MTEVSYVVEGFEEKFSAFKGKKIVLHGSREYAQAIIEHFDPIFHFAGIMSFDPIESDIFQGIPAYQQEELPVLKPDLIILTERVKYAEAAYHALRRICKQNNILIYNMYGLNESLLHRAAEKPAPEGPEEWIQYCAGFDRVVFEVVDTLLWIPMTGEKPMVRETLSSLITWLRGQGKSVGFSLRRSFPEDLQLRALREYDLLSDEETELIRRKGEDLSFRALREAHPGEKILYIGNGLVNEFILPRCYGIETCRIGEGFDLICLAPNQEETARKPFSPDLRQQIEAEILDHACISFDVFDTLLIRKVLFPADVFALTERRAKLAGFEADNFAAARRRAEQDNGCATLDWIYNDLADRFDWTEETAQRIKEIELSVEKDVLTPRTEVVDLLRFARRAGKKVFLTSDMYLSESILRRLLEENGITDYDRLLVSCDFGKSKQTGLYHELISLCEGAGSILHIGDNAATDGAVCEVLNIHSIVIPSALELARERGWQACIRSAHTLAERCLAGMVIAKLFRDPFQNPNLRERPVEDRLQRYGIGAVAPLVAGHMTWLLEKLRENDFDGVLFLARDGYLPISVYKQLREKLLLPRPIYYYANRNAAFLCRADSEEEIDRIMDMERKEGKTAPDILKDIYNIPEKDLLPWEEGETTLDYFDKHMPLIQRLAAESREGYLRYSERCGMKKGERYAVVDFIAAGSTQYFLEGFLPYRLKGYYYGTYVSSAKPRCDAEYYLQGTNTAFLNSYIEMEAYLTSPEPSQDKIKKDGTVTFAPEVRSTEDLQWFQAVYEASLACAEEFFRLFYQEGDAVSSALAAEMYAAEGYHWVQQRVFDDWLKIPIRTRAEARKIL